MLSRSRPFAIALLLLAAPTLVAAQESAASAPVCRVGKVEWGADGVARTTVDILTYNIEGLGFPGRVGREPDLARIGARLAALRASGEAPDVVLFQEVFSRAARRAVASTGYPTIVDGPRRQQRRTLPADREYRQGAGRRSFRYGEIGVRFLSSGLAVASHYTAEATRSEPYAHRNCAGLDCFANKGAMFVRLRIPGVPDPIDIFDTHMNSQGASRAPQRRTLPIYKAQSSELAAFINEENVVANPTMLGGDFNIRNSDARFDFLEPRMPLALARRYCQSPEHGCDVRMSSDGDAPWMDTQDLQFFRSGSRVTVRPLRMEAMFDGGPSGDRLSDHDGARVIYELSWRSPKEDVCPQG
jgi:endonuclease/exonuclease/phosphatase family metal-dependent hydrolase